MVTMHTIITVPIYEGLPCLDCETRNSTNKILQLLSETTLNVMINLQCIYLWVHKHRLQRPYGHLGYLAPKC